MIDALCGSSLLLNIILLGYILWPRKPRAVQGRIVKIDYTNWRGERRTRPIDPVALVFKKSGWHEKPQWFVEAFDVGADKHYDEPKDFALANIHQWIDPDAEDSK